MSKTAKRYRPRVSNTEHPRSGRRKGEKRRKLIESYAPPRKDTRRGGDYLSR